MPKLYTAVLRNKETKKDYFTVNGGTCDSYDEAVSRAKKHVGYTSGRCEIARVDERQISDYDYEDWLNPKPY